jgi:hypothetical protein
MYYGLRVETVLSHESLHTRECRWNIALDEIADRSVDVIRRTFDGTEFLIAADGSSVFARWPDHSTFEDTQCYLAGPVMGQVLQLRRRPTLHGSAIAVGDSAVALLGECGAGKSTLAAAFAKLGYPVLTEDVIAITTGLLVQPGYPLIRLWPHAVELLFGSPDALPNLTPTWDKRYLDLNQPEYRFQAEPLPLGAVYVLSGRVDHDAAPSVKPLSGGEAMMRLVANSYTGHLPSDDAYKAKEFSTFGKIAASVPVLALHPHSDPKRIYDTCELVASDFRSRLKS